MADYPTLSSTVSYPIKPDGKLEDNTIASDYEAGYQQTRPKFTRQRRVWGIKYNALSTEDKAILVTFEGTVNGTADAFNWTHPKDLTTHVVRFGPPGIQYDLIRGNRYRVEFTLIEV